MTYLLDIWTDDDARGTLVIAINKTADGKSRIFGWKTHGIFNDGGFFQWRHTGDEWIMEFYQQSGDMRLWLKDSWDSLPNPNNTPPEPWFKHDSGGFGGTIETPGLPAKLGPAIHWKMK